MTIARTPGWCCGRFLGENADDFVIAMPPSGLKDSYWRIIQKDASLVTIVLRDRAVNILKRLTFYDDYSQLMESPVNEENEHRFLPREKAGAMLVRFGKRCSLDLEKEDSMCF